jgi:integrase
MYDNTMSTGGPGRAEAEASHKRFLAALRADPDRSESTESNYARALEHLLAVAPVPPDELNDDHIAELRLRLDSTISELSGEPLLAPTVNLSISGVRAYLKWARRSDLLGHPGLRVRRDGRDKRRIRKERTLTAEEDVNLMTGCYQAASTSEDPIVVRDHALVLFLLTTGLRIGEALDLRWRDLDLDKRTVHVWRGKGGKERTSRMDSRAVEVMGRLYDMGQVRPITPVDHIAGIEAWGDTHHRAFGQDDPVFCGARPLEPMPSGSANYIAKRLSRQYTGNTYTPHCFRHTFCTRFLRHGNTLQDLETLMELAGHSSMNTTQGYLDLDGRIRDERFDRVTEAHWSAAKVSEEKNDERSDRSCLEEAEVDKVEELIESGAPIDDPQSLLDWS